MFFLSKTIVSSHEKIADHKPKGVCESIPARSNVEAEYGDIKYMHTNTEVIQYNGHHYCEVIFFDFHLTTDTIPGNYIYTRMKGKILFFIITFTCIGTALWAATGAFQLKGVFWSLN